MRKDKKKSYCVLPFNHMNLHPNGNVGICCVSKMSGNNSGFYKDSKGNMLNLNKQSLNEMWGSHSVKVIRKQMLKGIKPSACEGCYKIEDNGGVSRRLNENSRWKKHWALQPQIEFLDLRMSNLCNLKCLMCYPDSSSALCSDYKSWQDELPFVVSNPHMKNEDFKWFTEDMVEQLLEHKDTLKYLYINGGEPFIMPMQWKFLERLIEEGVSKNIEISYNTNATVFEDRFDEIWREFKSVTLGVSIDGVGERNKFIRYPSKWEVLNENILKIMRCKSLSHVNITCTIQWLNAPFLDEFYKWAIPITKRKPLSTVNQNILVFPNYLSLNCASKKFKQKLYDIYMESRYAPRILTPTMISYLESEEENETFWDQGLQYMDTVSKSRNMGNWKEIFDYVYEY